MGLVDRLIARAKRTPYFDLPGYMRRLWLVPYRQRISREINEGTAVSYDGTGPVSFRERPFVWCFQQLGIAIRLHKTSCARTPAATRTTTPGRS